MRTALEFTTNIMLDVISNNKTYFDELNKQIITGSHGYMEGRVLMKDLFITNSNGSSLRVKASSNSFSDDFRNAFGRNKALKVSGVSEINISIFSNPDSLIQYLSANNVCLYCPYPVERYAENNRIPAISFHPIDNDSVNVGYVIENTGLIPKVKVCQAYNDLHPVWILMPYEEEVAPQCLQQK